MAPSPSAPFWYSILPRLGSDAEFASARAVFDSCGYTDENICRRAGVASIDRHIVKERKEPLPPPADALDSLKMVYTDCRAVERPDLERTLPEGAVAALEALNLLVSDPERPSLMFSPVALFRVGSVLTACDRGIQPDGSPWLGMPDVVYQPVYRNTLQFLDRLPMIEADAVLDIGTGSGIAALLLASKTGHAWATDIAPRSVHFAEFNRRLAGTANVTVVEGDLYAPVEGRTFDLIVAHPPYVPAKTNKFIFREGGEDGEQILRAIIEGLPRFLQTDGRYYCAVMGSDRENEIFETRIRKWLGPQHEEFDIVLVADSLKTPADYLILLSTTSGTTVEEIRFMRELWDANKTQYVIRGPVLIRRFGGGRPPVTVRVQAGENLKYEHMDWLLEFETSLRQPGGWERLAAARPRVVPGTEMIVHHREQDGRFAVECFRFESRAPFKAGVRAPEWLGRTVAACDGTRSWKEYYDGLKEQGAIPAEAPLHEFAGMLRPFISNGILQF